MQFPHLHTLPVFEFHGSPGPAIVITAGMDGDEYASIDAAYELATFLQKETLVGKVTLLPIVNMAGFVAEMSKNPKDGKYPKHIYPGNKDGSDSEQLMWEMSERYIKDSLVWIDLHGGALTERLTPFVGTADVADPVLSKLTHAIRRAVTADILIAEPAGTWSKAKRLSDDSVVYVLLESGEMGKRDASLIDNHVRWCKEILVAVGVLTTSVPKKRTPKTVLTRLHEYVAQEKGIWFPAAKPLGSIQKGTVLGEIRSLDGKKKRPLIAKESGVTLWSKTGLSVQKGDVLWAIGD